jgi:hypothetical protein
VKRTPDRHPIDQRPRLPDISLIQTPVRRMGLTDPGRRAYLRFLLPEADRIMARIPARIGWDRVGQASMISAKSGVGIRAARFPCAAGPGSVGRKPSLGLKFVEVAGRS